MTHTKQIHGYTYEIIDTYDTLTLGKLDLDGIKLYNIFHKDIIKHVMITKLDAIEQFNKLKGVNNE
jgi:hypothetical protein